MNELIRNLPGSFWRMWLFCLLLPLPPMVFWHSHDGRFVGLCLFFTSCTMLVIALALLVSWLVFSASGLVFNDPHDLIAPVLGFAAMIPSLCIAPFYGLTLRKPLPAVVFTLFSLGSMKLVAGSMACLVYGWHADQLGETTLTWTHPNVIVCALLSAASVLSLVFYLMGAKQFGFVCQRGGFENGTSFPSEARNSSH